MYYNANNNSFFYKLVVNFVGTGGGFVPVNSPQAVPQQVVVVTNTPRWAPNPMTVTCPFCSANVTTSISSEPGAMAWIIGGLLCVFG